MSSEFQQNLTIFDIAEAAGVSVTTVSRILNNKPDVSAKTIAKVRDVMERLGYQPHASARRLASGRSNVIAVLPHATAGELGSVTYEYITGIVDAAEAGDFSVNLLPRSTTEDKLRSLFGSGQFDGIALLQVQTNDWRVEALRQSGKPFVLVGRTEDTAGVSYVDVDLVRGAHEMVEAVAARGHRRIVLIGNALHQKVRRFSARLIHDGYQSGMAGLGLEPLVIDTEFSIDGVVQAIKDGLTAAPAPSCFFIGGHVAMPQILNRLREDGVDVPGKVSLVSILPDPVAEITTPRTTTIDLPGRELGQHAGRTLIDHVTGRAGTRQILLPPQIIWRDSVRTTAEGNV
ncbi:LacI family DNA-binding transcriptional regulator [Devosia ginsengisoli]|uniref:LacI family DNA-binding transcriptional regulator n=1 Tax=Devosia ginsengisoli TaxID=400770 RepID=UPI0026E993DF|nr:LacI family DNA-binding transcriptional regulator [Devosia ginsengisoli]MCR6670687.1 LacI family transcriptional regulator [Devosia ginsengisoli]